ncbi:MAG TPA: transglutaminase-like domain-containing protein, partial [Vicinamibacteria bacterium]|nr:transglutaminase-like domain-containing protein [Vicinamibacteria bacterium]
ATLGGLGPWFRLPLPARALITPGRLDELRFTPLLPEAWPLLLPRGVAAVTAAVEVLELDADGLVRVGPGALPAIYGAVVATAPSAAADDDAGREAALQVPAGLDPRVRALAARLVPQDTAPAERVARVVAHLRGGYAYTLAPGRFRPEADPVAQFLFEKKQGYCEYFATAAVLLLRLTGVPARFVKGLRVSRRDDYGDGLFVLRESDAHAWVEAWLPGRGWVEVDPTPPALAGGDTRSPGTAEKAIERLRAAGAEAWALLTGPGPLSLVRWLAASALGWLDLRRAALAATLLAMLFVGRRLWRRLRDAHRERRRRLRARASQSVPVELRRAIVDLEQRWRASGQPRPPSRGLREHAALVTPSSAAGAPALAAQRLVALYYAARFGGQPPAPRRLPAFTSKENRGRRVLVLPNRRGGAR